MAQWKGFKSEATVVWEKGVLEHFRKEPEKHLQQRVINKIFLKTLRDLFMARVQLPQGTSATTVTAQKLKFSI